MRNTRKFDFIKRYLYIRTQNFKILFTNIFQKSAVKCCKHVIVNRYNGYET